MIPPGDTRILTTLAHEEGFSRPASLAEALRPEERHVSYVGKPFEHDIFVSYSHGDADGTGDSKLKQWSQAFARELESELNTDPRLAGTIRIFLDQDHRPSQSIDPLSALTDESS